MGTTKYSTPINFEDLKPENIKTDKQKTIEQIDKRIVELENEIENFKIEQMRNNQQYLKNFKMKHASRALECANNIVKINKKIESYKKVRAKHV